MLEKPDLDERLILACLAKSWGLVVDRLVFLPIGHDAFAYAYRLELAGGEMRFLKIRRGTVNQAGLAIPRLLYEQRLAPVIAPLPTASGDLWAGLDEYALIVYPFVEGRAGKDGGLADAQWIAYGSALKGVHAAEIPSGLAAMMRYEDYEPASAHKVRALEALFAAESPDDPFAQELGAFWRAQRGTIHSLLERAEALGRQLRDRGLPWVLCHADIHTANTMVDSQGNLWIVDWDEAMLAPKERDLMFVIGGGISRNLVKPENEPAFLRGYGPTPIDALALAYYRYAWAVSDMGEYGDSACFRPDLGDVSRRDSVDGFKRLFAPGNIVELALASGTESGQNLAM